MKKTSILILFSVLLTMMVSAQRWMPVGTVLTQSLIKLSAGGSPIGLKASIITIKDTIRVKDKLCTYGTIGASVLDTTTTSGFSFITYQEAGVVYWYRPVLKDFTVLFDFTKNVGDSWDIDGLFNAVGGGYCSRHIEVAKRDTVVINGFPLTRLELKTKDTLPPRFLKVIQSVGGLGEPYPEHAPCFKGIVDDYTEFMGLRCIDHPDIGFHDFKIVPTCCDCDFEPISIKSFEQSNDINISPNPSSGNITINVRGLVAFNNSMNAKVYDMMGKVVFEKPIHFNNYETIINIPVTTGVYILELQQSHGQIFHKRIVRL
ncbi:MAG: T9SS type A sorting domain-containing protein [Bacteroidota bacterium]